MNPPDKVDQREGGVELLRIVLICGVISHHILIHGVGIFNPEEMSIISWLKTLLNSACTAAVNCFVLISGYYGIRLRGARVLHLVLQTLFFSILIGVSFAVMGKASWTKDLFMSMFLPISFNVWWFTTTYVFLVLLSPLLNHLGRTMEKRPLTLLLLMFMVMEYGVGYAGSLNTMWGQGGYTLMNFIGMYLIGTWLKRFHAGWPRWVYALIFPAAVTSILSGAVLAILFQRGDLIFPYVFAYNNPFVVLSACALFFLFKGFQVRATWIHGLSPLVFGIYLIHDHPLVRGILYRDWLQVQPYANDWRFFLLWPIWLGIIFTAGGIVEWLRARAFAPLERRLVRLEFIAAIDATLENFAGARPATSNFPSPSAGVATVQSADRPVTNSSGASHS